MIETNSLWTLTCDVCGEKSDPALMREHIANGWRWDRYFQGLGYVFRNLSCGKKCRTEWETTYLILLSLKPLGSNDLESFGGYVEKTGSDIKYFQTMADYERQQRDTYHRQLEYERSKDAERLTLVGRVWQRIKEL